MSEKIYLIRDHIWAKTKRTFELRKNGFNDYRVCRCCGLIRETNRLTFKNSYFRTIAPPQGIDSMQCFADEETIKRIQDSHGKHVHVLSQKSDEPVVLSNPSIVVTDRASLFQRYAIRETDNQWQDSVDGWCSVEIYRLMHDGQLPPEGDKSVSWVTRFLDKLITKDEWWFTIVMARKDWGNLVTTARRLVYMCADEIVKELASEQQ